MKLNELLIFLDDLRTKHSRMPPPLGAKVLTFMCTSLTQGRAPTVFVRRLRGIQAGAAPSELAVVLEAGLPRALEPGECVAASIIRAELVQGFQVKTAAQVGWGAFPVLVELRDTTATLRGQHVFTVHPTPHTAAYFEKVPVDAVTELLSNVKYAVLAIGQDANVSPRYILHTEINQGRLVLFHGDAKFNKTHINLLRNPIERRVVVDLETLNGYALTAQVAELRREDNVAVFDSITKAFIQGGFGQPSRIYRSDVTDFERITVQT